MADKPSTVASLVTRALAPILLLMIVLGVLGVIGVYRTNATVNHVLDDVAPGIAANREYLQVMTDAETGVRGWVIQGKPSALQPYRRALVRLPEVTASLQGFADLKPGLGELIDRQSELSERWLTVYARPRLAAEPGDDGYDRRKFVQGKRAFDELRATNARIDASFDDEADEARHTARLAYRRAVVAVVVLTVLAALVGWVLARRLRRRVADPLRELERTVHLQAAGDISARARVFGPSEVAAVATAFNVLAEENERAQAVETESSARLLQLDHAKDDFVSNVSHELRTPLTSIKGYLELLQETCGPVEGTEQMWLVVNRNVHRLGLLIEDLLALANVESRDTTLTEVHLDEVVDDVVTDLRIAASNRDIDFVLELPGSRVPVLADKIQVMRAVLNVVSNAVKFCRAGGRVEVRLVNDGQEATLTVRDNGIGIPAGELPRLGSRFFRGTNAVDLQIGGTGLGIRMVQTIVAKHGGRVSIDSVQDEYTVVTIQLPVRGGSYDGTEPVRD
ncbi:HAMP domain-containing protein [Nocardioides sp. JQ2195]|uniref:sensor histidine kinase n=1 Tax=Nocardioides sp. JQ2195 TaxID=2592334 RepID=UPI00143EA210|nr:ATP-binding protein [Nocardioides sp. JQ2195]QIX27442.1 HAMP domain-containing protein [Nocardioides sp. JQ2195]